MKFLQPCDYPHQDRLPFPCSSGWHRTRHRAAVAPPSSAANQQCTQVCRLCWLINWRAPCTFRPLRAIQPSATRMFACHTWANRQPDHGDARSVPACAGDSLESWAWAGSCFGNCCPLIIVLSSRRLPAQLADKWPEPAGHPASGGHCCAGRRHQCAVQNPCHR